MELVKLRSRKCFDYKRPANFGTTRLSSMDHNVDFTDTTVVHQF